MDIPDLCGAFASALHCPPPCGVCATPAESRDRVAGRERPTAVEPRPRCT